MTQAILRELWRAWSHLTQSLVSSSNTQVWLKATSRGGRLFPRDALHPTCRCVPGSRSLGQGEGKQRPLLPRLSSWGPPALSQGWLLIVPPQPRRLPSLKWESSFPDTPPPFLALPSFELRPPAPPPRYR